MPRCAVVGSPVAHSLSPLLHAAAYAALGLGDWRYGRSEVPSGRLAGHVAGLGPDWVGLSVTMPGKEEALALAATAAPAALRVGAANTLTRAGDGWRADSTDAEGLREALREAGVTGPRRALLVGSGATARSALVALAELGVREVSVLVRDRVRERTQAVADDLGVQLEPHRYDGRRAVEGAEVVVSTVPADAGPPPHRLGPVAGTVVLDVVYAPWPSPLASAVAEAGARAVGGGTMLLYQAAAQVRLMTGRSAPVAAMRAALAQVLPEVRQGGTT